mmetsp:Transcript_17593/g.57985  ORF Transcript_17593/g.57985 Transcript_17593/m.57985 type:complete len:90 (-) Transcript_17593:82-351(-)
MSAGACMGMRTGKVVDEPRCSPARPSSRLLASSQQDPLDRPLRRTNDDKARSQYGCPSRAKQLAALKASMEMIKCHRRIKDSLGRHVAL